MSLAAWLHYITGANLLVYTRIYHCCYRAPNWSRLQMFESIPYICQAYNWIQHSAVF
jgi:hypothetical protein